jgi:EpsI family protein
MTRSDQAPAHLVLRSWLLAGLLIGSGLLGWQLQPAGPVGRKTAAPDLATLIPTQFGSWRQAPQANRILVAERLRAQVDSAYEATLERIYLGPDGSHIMLSIAYGHNQLHERLQAHRPEFCYRAQGFDLSGGNDETLALAGGSLPLRRLLARRDQRIEPISYWMTIGDQALLPGLSRKFAQLQHGLRGEVPDGLLVRVSSLQQDRERAHQVHDRFIRDLLAAMPSALRTRLTGHPQPANRL